MTGQVTYLNKEDIMSTNILKDNLNKFKDKIKEKWADLTDDDVASLTGDVEQLADTLQQRLGYAKEQATATAREFIKDFEDTFKNDDDKNCGSSTMKENADQAVDEIGDIGKNVGKKTVAVAKNIKEDVGKYGKSVAEFIQHKPYQSIAIVVIAGLILGLLLRKN